LIITHNYTQKYPKNSEIAKYLPVNTQKYIGNKLLGIPRKDYSILKSKYYLNDLVDNRFSAGA